MPYRLPFSLRKRFIHVHFRDHFVGWSSTWCAKKICWTVGPLETVRIVAVTDSKSTSAARGISSSTSRRESPRDANDTMIFYLGVKVLEFFTNGFWKKKVVAQVGVARMLISAAKLAWAGDVSSIIRLPRLIRRGGVFMVNMGAERVMPRQRTEAHQTWENLRARQKPDCTLER